MYKLIIVDDETEVREGLENLDWTALGIQLVGSFRHGLEALEYMIQVPIDIVLSDIRMPFMDGLELSNKISTQYPFVKIVILSGYDDFEYARACMRNGVSDYLLKPTKFDELAITFTKAVDLLNQEKQHQEKLLVIERRAHLSALKLRRHFLKGLMFEELSEAEIMESASEGEVLLSETGYLVSVIQLDAKVKNRQSYLPNEWNLILFALENVLSELWDRVGINYHYVDPINGNCYLLSCGDIHLEMIIKEMEQLNKSLTRFRGLFLSTLSIGVGQVVDKVISVPVSRRKAEKMLQNENEGDNVSFVACYSEENDNQGSDIEQVGNEKAQDRIQAANTDSEIELNSNDNIVIESAKDYIHQNYMRSITLTEVAENVHVSPNYLSFLYKSVTGQNFSHYVTQYRVDQAINLLKDPKYKIYEISEMVGYTNPGYFSEIFKRVTGKLPNDYRH
ncbi:response regulator transcription factor [Cohnella abietis]|uniref:DNA-binding response regulator n=1 Tax=Cohnella abietis TaxID=2507935 RepID=A0A3T1D0F2_9BACL|nr:response regulator [Cohnella abietis]BBI31580.1 hypothetical protein KCTCHS21_09790 [Cohnella abietis]